MAHNKLYRNFIILQEDERGYSHANDKALSGYAKIEAKGDKCKVSFYAQNLRKEDKYSMVLICCKRDLKQLIDIGPLAINEVGKGDTSKEYYINNIAGLGISYEKISGAAICRNKDNENEFIMHGFMNGEDSADNWRKFKLIKADSKKYINKLDAEPIKKDVITSDISSKVITTQPDNLEAKSIKTSKFQNELVERKKYENNLYPKENIELSDSNNNSKFEEKTNKIPGNHVNIAQTKDALGEDRKKCKETKKEEKNDKCDKCNHTYDLHEDIEGSINKLAQNLDTYDGIADIKINHHIHEDVIIYGFIKAKSDYSDNWKKFKLEKNCKMEDKDYSNIPNYKRIEENFKLDKLSDINDSDRMDTIDFDKYENDIKPPVKIKKSTETGQTTTGNMGTSTGGMPQTPVGTVTTNTEGMGQTTTGTGGENMCKCKPWPSYGMNQMGTGMENMTQAGCNVHCQLDLNNGESASLKMTQPTTSSKFNIIGNIGKYFEKIAEEFVPYLGNLIDINYCKWYKIIVNNIEDLSDESNYNKYTLAYYPMLNYYPYISNEGHFLLGYKCNKDGDMKYIIYAIPGSKDKKDQPYGGRTGFVTWTSDGKTGKGYWLMFYDFKNSSIVIPTR